MPTEPVFTAKEKVIHKFEHLSDNKSPLLCFTLRVKTQNLSSRTESASMFSPIYFDRQEDFELSQFNVM